MNTPNNKNKPTLSFFSLKLFIEKIKGYDVVFTLKEEENGNISGTYEGVEKMNQSNKKITNQDLMNLIVDMKKDIDKRFEDIDKRFEDIDKRFEDIDKRFEDMNKDMNKRFEDMNKRFDKMDAKIDLMIQTPTMNNEIDHEALAKIDAR